ncbi:uncharacterized protein FA14DRAFT_79185 [Meira miltonrushii]|uniref:Uncharacterized protein n=1 Tax=Meira miltonrushii TaxID=1280837 RepID=A0A316V6K9_9BASI|nr:uncharacterized protein FA14DRAFT_79185 [Meira miltonrushii]PWN32894.1 hypothetical protein FA14DRAFT_79185 [Meira miltonrushii]
MEIERGELLCQRASKVDQTAQKGQSKSQSARDDFEKQLDAFLPPSGSQSESWQLKQLRASFGHTGSIYSKNTPLSEYNAGECNGIRTTTHGKSRDHNEREVELYWNDNRLIWSVAGIAIRTFSFEKSVRWACWAWFDVQETKGRSSQRALCIFLQSSMIIQFPHTGQEYVKRLDFEVLKVVVLDVGIFVQRRSEREDRKRHERSLQADRDFDLDAIFQDEPLPNLFYLRRPLDELKPVQVFEASEGARRASSRPYTLMKESSKLFNSIEERIVNVHKIKSKKSPASDVLVTISDDDKKVHFYSLRIKPTLTDEPQSANHANGDLPKRPRLSSATRGRTPSHRRTSRLESRSSFAAGQSMRMSMNAGQRPGASIIERSRVSSGHAHLYGLGLPTVSNAPRQEVAEIQMEEADGIRHVIQSIDGVQVHKDRDLLEQILQPHVASAPHQGDELIQDILDASHVYLNPTQASRVQQRTQDMQTEKHTTRQALWQSFCSIFIQGAMTENDSPAREETAWNRMLQSASKEEQMYSTLLPSFPSNDREYCSHLWQDAPLKKDVDHVSAAVMLNMIAQDLRLNTRRISSDLERVAHLILSIAIECKWSNWIRYWSSMIGVDHYAENDTAANDEPVLFDIYDDLRNFMTNQSTSKPSSILRPRSARIRSTYEAFQLPAAFFKLMSGRVCSTTDARSYRVVEAMLANNIDEDFLQNVPLSIALPLLEACHVSRSDPPLSWGQKAYTLVGRPDLALQLSKKVQAEGDRSRKEINNSAESARKQRGDAPKLPGICFQLFNKDHRLIDVSNILQTHRAVATRGPAESNTAGNQMDEEVMAEQQKRIFVSVSDRLKATSVGRAMFLLSSQPIQMAKQLKISPVCLRIKMLCHCIVTHREPDAESAEMEWPEFHNGVSAALMLATEEVQVESSWIYSQTSSAFNSRHAGFIFGLGLQGQLRNLGKIHAHHYLSNRHLTTTIGLLLGIAVSFVGSCDVMAKALMSIHLIHTLPTHSKPLKTTMLEQSAALVGLGFVFLGSYDAWASRMALRALSTDLVMTDDNQMLRRESFSLSAGFALGLICLGKGRQHKTSVEIEREIVPHLENVIKQCSSGGRASDKNGKTSSQNSKNSSAFEWRPDISLTTTPASIALALIYLRSNRADIAAKLALPEYIAELNEIRPDILQIRVLCRSLIMWDDIKPTQRWLESTLPPFFHKFDLDRNEDVGESVQSALYNMRIGAIFAVGLKFAGSNDHTAKEFLLNQLSIIQSKAEVRPITFFDKVRQQVLRSAIDTTLTSLAIVTAGSGDVEIMKLIRKTLFKSDQMRYGNYMASTMAMGMLFLGGGRYTLGSSDIAIAALLIAFFPLYPINAQDNRAYLQAYRHFWILAVEARLLSVKDIRSGETSHTPIDILLNSNGGEQSNQGETPCVLPEVDQIDTIRIASDRYLHAAIDVKTNKHHRRTLLDTQTMFAMRRLASLSHEQDPHGCASLLEQQKGLQVELSVPLKSHTSLATIRSWQQESESLAAEIRTSIDRPMIKDALDIIYGGSRALDERSEDLQSKAEEVALELFMVQSLSHCLCEDKLPIWSDLILLYTKVRNIIRSIESEGTISIGDRMFLIDLAFLHGNQDRITSLFNNKPLLPHDFIGRLLHRIEEGVTRL